MASPSRPRLWFLICGVVLIAGLLVSRPRLQDAVMLRAALAEPSVETELVEELLLTAAEPLVVGERFYRTGKIPHRIAALRALSRTTREVSLEPLPGWLHDAALDADFQVRELAIGLLGQVGRDLSAPLFRAGLLDVDPELKHVALRAALAAGLTNFITDIAALLDHHDLEVRIAASGALRQWTGEDFGVRRSKLAGAYNEAGVMEDETHPARTEQVLAGLEQWRSWWRQNAANWTGLTPPEAAQAREAPRPAPDFILPNLAGEPVRLSQFRGRPVFINFWATWCTACWTELPELVKLHERYADRLVILGIALDGLPDQHELEHGHSHDHDGPAGHEEAAPKAGSDVAHDELVKLVGGFAEKRGLKYPILLDPKGATSLVYQGNELPVNVLVDAEGHLRRRFVGPRSPAAFDAMIAELTKPGR
jgi:peroxiredoxin/DNA-binding transcriptional ArsR family regulator